MRTSEGVTPAPDWMLVAAFVAFTSLYVLLAAIFVRLLRNMATGAPPDLEEEIPLESTQNSPQGGSTRRGSRDA